MATVAEWGPAAWKFLHAVTFSYPDEPSLQDQQAAEQLFTSLRVLLPCDACREHYDAEIRQHHPNTASRTLLSSWLVDLHNRVNSRLGKPLFLYEQAKSVYSSQCTTDCTKSRAALKTTAEQNTAVQGLIWFVIIATLLFVVYKYRKA
jgi:hypothetical protein